MDNIIEKSMERMSKSSFDFIFILVKTLFNFLDKNEISILNFVILPIFLRGYKQKIKDI
jgi:hypothetical protein